MAAIPLTMINEPEIGTLIPQLFDDMPEAVVWFRPVFKNDQKDQITDFEIQYANHAAGSMVGVPRSEFIGTLLRSSTLHDPITNTVIFNQCLAVWNASKPVEFRYFSPNFDRHFHVQRKRVGDGILSTARNPTPLMQNEIQAEQDRDLLTSILNASINGLFAVEAVRDQHDNIVDFLFLKCNRKLEKVLGKKADEIIGKSYLSILPTSIENGMFDMKRRVIETGEPIETEFYYKGSGIDGWFQVSIAPLGKNGVLETFTDITESKKDKEQLALSAAQFRTVVNSSKAGMFTLVPVKDESGEVIDFRFRIVNQAVASYIGQTAEILTGSLASVYFPAYTTNGLFELYKDNYITSKPYNFDFHYEDGYDVFFNIDVVKMGDEVLVTFTDHTSLKRLQREQEKTFLELKRSNEHLEDFTSAASHDLKEPIRKVLFFTGRLREKLIGRLSGEEERILQRVETATARMKTLVDDLLEYSHVNRGQQAFEEVDLNRKLQQVEADLELLIAEKGAILHIGELPAIKGHSRQIEQLFHNLLSNALKYSKPGVQPIVKITSRKVHGGEAPAFFSSEDRTQWFQLIEVSDNGIGFDQQYADKIFNIFTRLHGNNEYSGSVVGLAIVKKVVENHKGYVTAEGEPGKGATFSVWLPAN